MKRICSECKKEIFGRALVVASLEEKDFGREYFFHAYCAKKSLDIMPVYKS